MGTTSGDNLADLTRVRFTNLGKMMYPALNVTKQEVIAYYIRMAPRMLPFLSGRPLTMHRFPEGVEGEEFYEKDTPQGTPSFVETYTWWSKTAERNVHFVLCNNLDTLIWLANLASLEIHTTLSVTKSFASPDFLFVDIDPEPPLTFDAVIEVARAVKEDLERHGLQPYAKMSGKKGLHILVPLQPKYRYGEVRDFVHRIGKDIAKSVPFVVSEFPRSRDPGTVFVDYLQNAHGKTMAAPYSLRATPSATVSAPLRWEELKNGIRPENFNIRTMLVRNEDPWRDILENRQSFSKA